MKILLYPCPGKDEAGNPKPPKIILKDQYATLVITVAYFAHESAVICVAPANKPSNSLDGNIVGVLDEDFILFMPGPGFHPETFRIPPYNFGKAVRVIHKIPELDLLVREYLKALKSKYKNLLKDAKLINEFAMFSEIQLEGV